MLFAFGLLILKKYGAIVDSNKDNLFSTGISYGLMGAGFIGIGVSDIFLRFYKKGRKGKRDRDSVPLYLFLPSL